MRTASPLGVACVCLVVGYGSLSAGCHSPAAETSDERLRPTLTTETLQVRRINLVDDQGHSQLYMSGEESGMGPFIVMQDTSDEESPLVMMGLTKEHDGTGPGGAKRSRSAFIHAECGDYGNLNIVVEPNGASISMGSDETDGFEIACMKDGIVVTVEPKDSTAAPVPSKAGDAKAVPDPGKRGVRLKLENGRLVVRDLSGRELGAIADSPASPK